MPCHAILNAINTELVEYGKTISEVSLDNRMLIIRFMIPSNISLIGFTFSFEKTQHFCREVVVIAIYVFGPPR